MRNFVLCYQYYYTWSYSAAKSFKERWNDSKNHRLIIWKWPTCCKYQGPPSSTLSTLEAIGGWWTNRHSTYKYEHHQWLGSTWYGTIEKYQNVWWQWWVDSEFLDPLACFLRSLLEIISPTLRNCEGQIYYNNWHLWQYPCVFWSWWMLSTVYCVTNFT